MPPGNHGLLLHGLHGHDRPRPPQRRKRLLQVVGRNRRQNGYRFPIGGNDDVMLLGQPTPDLGQVAAEFTALTNRMAGSSAVLVGLYNCDRMPQDRPIIAFLVFRAYGPTSHTQTSGPIMKRVGAVRGPPPAAEARAQGYDHACRDGIVANHYQ